MIRPEALEDARGREWRLMHSFQPRDTTLSADEDCSISLGGRMKMAISAATLTRGATTAVGCEIPIGEHCRATLLHTGNVAPSIVLRSAHGQVVCRGRPRFG